MLTIEDARASDLAAICDIAHRTWPVTYGDILSEAQLQYMLALFYTNDALQRNVDAGQHFLLAKDSQQIIGFASYQYDYKDSTTHIHKIYLLPERQGSGIGRKLIDEIASRSASAGQLALTLNVNRQNKAVEFYKSIGFSVIDQVDIELEHGYLMEDFIMRRSI